MKALFRCEKNWQKINVQRFSANFLFSKNGKCRSITYSGDFATLPLEYFCRYFLQTYFLLVIPDPSTHHLPQRSHQRTDLSASGTIRMDSESLSEHRRSAGRE